MDKKEKLTHIFTHMLKELGVDLADDNFTDTPKRMAKMYVDEIFEGLNGESEPNITVFKNEGEHAYSGIVMLKDIRVYSMCAHHFLPFPMNINIAYIPNDNVVGISKLARIAKYFARRPQIQERLTEEIADYIEKKLNPKGVAVMIEGEHFCMKMRGVENETSVMKTTVLRGVFKTSVPTREELYNLLK